MGPYPTYEGDLNFQGNVTLDFGAEDVRISYSLQGLEKDCVKTNPSMSFFAFFFFRKKKVREVVFCFSTAPLTLKQRTFRSTCTNF